MYSYLQGKLVEKTVTKAIIDINGIGYELVIPLSTYHALPEVGAVVKLNTYLYVREEILRLYGFVTRDEKDFFELINSVSGFGPKVSISILSHINISDFKRAILEDDIAILTQVPGIGKKSAERLLLELKSKVDTVLPIEGQVKSVKGKDANRLAEDIILALISLGYNQAQAKKSFQRVATEGDVSGVGLEELIKRCLTVI